MLALLHARRLALLAMIGSALLGALIGSLLLPVHLGPVAAIVVTLVFIVGGVLIPYVLGLVTGVYYEAVWLEALFGGVGGFHAVLLTNSFLTGSLLSCGLLAAAWAGAIYTNSLIDYQGEPATPPATGLRATDED